MNKTWLGLMLILLGIFVGLFVGLYLCLYGGIIQIVNGVKDSWSAIPIAVGLVRILCTSIAGWISALLLIVPGWALIKN